MAKRLFGHKNLRIFLHEIFSEAKPGLKYYVITVGGKKFDEVMAAESLCSSASVIPTGVNAIQYMNDRYEQKQTCLGWKGYLDGSEGL